MKLFLLIAAIAAIILAGFLAGGSSSSMENLTVNWGFSQFPAEYTCDSTNVSPRIEISGLNAMPNVTSAAMIMEDPDAPNGTFTHWVIWNLPTVNVIPGNIPNVANVTTPIKATQGANGIGKIGYIGPCPPPGKPHRYFLRVYGLDRELDLMPGSNRSALENAMMGHIVLQGEAMATYGR
jgi:Raf kinase inhibitor-like YbhB/YbcL family protein